MKNKIVGILVCMLLIATAVPAVISGKNGEINDTFSNHLFTGTAKMATTLPIVGSLRDTRIAPIASSRSTQSCSLGSWIQQAKILAPDGASNDLFSNSGMVDGDTAIIGAQLDDDNGIDSGAAYVFIRTGTTWTQQAKLLPADGAAGDYFGYTVAIDDDTALIGAYNDDDMGPDSGSAYVFTRSDTTWTQQQKLTASDGAAADHFSSVGISISGDTALVGAWGDDFAKGSAYVFTRNDTTWTQQTKLTPSDATQGKYFGWWVGLDGDTALIAAGGDNSLTGAAYVFIRTGTTWTEQAKLIASDGAPNDQFGYSVHISGDSALISANYDDDNGLNSGSAYVFTRTGTTWTQQAKLLPSDGAAGDNFGVGLSIEGDTALIGAVFDDDNGMDSGSAYIFTRTGTTWTQDAKLLPEDGSGGDYFSGWTASISGDTALIGALYDDDNGMDSGSAYIFIKENEPPAADFSWTPQNPSIHQEIAFDASASQDPDGTITLYEWDWNNDGVYEETHSAPATTHTWAIAGNYPVTLRVTDDDNATDNITKTVDVSGITLKIDINGGIGVKAIITNNGTSDATDVPWQIHVEGGMLGMINKTVNGTVDIPAGESVTVKTEMLLGFGTISIIAKVADEEQTAEGTQIIIFSLV